MSRDRSGSGSLRNFNDASMRAGAGEDDPRAKEGREAAEVPVKAAPEGRASPINTAEARKTLIVRRGNSTGGPEANALEKIAASLAEAVGRKTRISLEMISAANPATTASASAEAPLGRDGDGKIRTARPLI